MLLVTTAAHLHPHTFTHTEIKKISAYTLRQKLKELQFYTCQFLKISFLQEVIKTLFLQMRKITTKRDMNHPTLKACLRLDAKKKEQSESNCSVI